MNNRALIKDYLERSKVRVEALDLFFKHKSWANVVRESQEVVELLLKALLRMHNIEVPRVHDVSDALRASSDQLSPTTRSKLKELTEISKDLRRDRELAFYGSEDLTPSDFYSEEDAAQAREGARTVLKIVSAEWRKN